MFMFMYNYWFQETDWMDVGWDLIHVTWDNWDQPWGSV